MQKTTFEGFSGGGGMVIVSVKLPKKMVVDAWDVERRQFLGKVERAKELLGKLGIC